MPNSDPWDRFVHPYLTLMSDYYIISPIEHQKLCFTSGEVASENITFGVMSERKINFTPDKIKFSVSFMLKYGKINLFQSVSHRHSKLTFFLVITRQFYDVQRVYCGKY